MVRISNLSAHLPPSAGEELKSSLEGIRRLAGDSVKVVRNISLLLRPSMLDDLGLLPALEWQAREVSRQSGMRVSVAAEDSLDELPETHKTCLYRLVQEALHNCSRHSGGRTVRITVRCESHWLRLSVQDDGTGFEVAREKGLGLLGMQERVTSLGGEFLIKSEPGCGTLLAASLPFVRGPKLNEHESDSTYSARG
jgi:signal transduction histidine kinase